MGGRLIRVAAAGLVLGALAAPLAGCGDPAERTRAHVERARAHLAAGSLHKARVELRNALQIEPRNVAARMLLGRVLESLGSLPEATARYRGVLVDDPDNLEARIRLARILVIGGHLDEAAALGDEILARAPGHLEGLLLQAGIALRRQERDRAADLARKVLAREPAEPTASSILASIRLRSGRGAEAAALLGEAVRAHPGNAALRVQQARTLARLGDTRGAVEAMRDLIDLEPAALVHRRRLADYLAGLGRVDEAEAVLRAAIAAGATDPRAPGDDPRLVLARLLLRHRGPDAARRELERLVEADRDAGRLRLALAEVVAAQGESAAARAIHREVIERADGRPVAHEARVALAASLLEAGRADEAAGLLEEVIAARPRHRAALLLRAAMALADHAPERAIADLRIVLRDAPGSAAALRLRARAHARNTEPDLAREDFRRLLEAVPREAAANLALAHEIGAAAPDREWESELAEAALDAAAAALERRLSLAPDDAEARLERAAVALERGDAATAREHLDALPEPARESGVARRLRRAADEVEDGADPAARALARGIALERAGRREAAMRAYEAALAARPDLVVARNNLANLLASGGPEAASLERARALAEPLAAAEHPALRDTYAWVQIRTGRPGRALPVLEALVAEHPDRALYRYHLAEALDALGRSGRARRELERAIGGDPFPGLEAARAKLAEIEARR